MAVEIALLKAARPDLDPSTEGLLRRIERLEQGTGASGRGSCRRRTPHPLRALKRPRDGPPSATRGRASPIRRARAPKTSGTLRGRRAARAPRCSEPPAASRPAGLEPTLSPEQLPSRSSRDDRRWSRLRGGRDGRPSRWDPPPTGPAGRLPSTWSTSSGFWPSVIDKLAGDEPRFGRDLRGSSAGRGRCGEEDRDRSASPPSTPSTNARPRRPRSGSRWQTALEAVVGERLRPAYVVLDGEAPRAARRLRRRGDRSRCAGGEAEERVRRGGGGLGGQRWNARGL